MTAADERPLKRRKGGGPTWAPVPEQHRTSPTPRAASMAAADAQPTASAARASERKSKAGPSAGVREGWRRFAADLAVAERAAAAAEGGFAFAFVEGALVKAVREGHWLLLDEVRLARKHLPSGTGFLHNPTAADLYSAGHVRVTWFVVHAATTAIICSGPQCGHGPCFVCCKGST